MQLLADLRRRGIKLEIHEDRLRYSPRSAVTNDLLEELRVHKPCLMALLRAGAESTTIDHHDKGWEDAVPVEEVPPCPKCGRLEGWQTVAGDLYGIASGRWRCLHCDPPIRSRQLLRWKDYLLGKR